MEQVQQIKRFSQENLFGQLKRFSSELQQERVRLTVLFKDFFDRIQLKARKNYIDLGIQIKELPQVVSANKFLLKELLTYLFQYLFQRTFGQQISLTIQCDKAIKSNSKGVKLNFLIMVKCSSLQNFESLVQILNQKLYNIQVEQKQLAGSFSDEEIIIKHLINCLRGSVQQAEMDKKKNQLKLEISLNLDKDLSCQEWSGQLSRSISILNLKLITEESFHSENLSSSDEMHNIFIPDIAFQGRKPGDLFKETKIRLRENKAQRYVFYFSQIPHKVNSHLKSCQQEIEKKKKKKVKTIQPKVDSESYKMQKDSKEKILITASQSYQFCIKTKSQLDFQQFNKKRVRSYQEDEKWYRV